VDEEGENVTYKRLIAELAEKGRLLAIYPWRSFVEAGGLMAYGSDLSEMGAPHRRHS
jgi:putative ABC transport system substrate-binding protein